MKIWDEDLPGARVIDFIHLVSAIVPAVPISDDGDVLG